MADLNSRKTDESDSAEMLEDMNSLDEILQQLQDFSFPRPHIRTVNQRGLHSPYQQGQHLLSDLGHYIPLEQGQHLHPEQDQHITPEQGQHLPPEQGQHLPHEQGQRIPHEQGQRSSSPIPARVSSLPQDDLSVNYKKDETGCSTVLVNGETEENPEKENLKFGEVETIKVSSTSGLRDSVKPKLILDTRETILNPTMNLGPGEGRWEGVGTQELDKGVGLEEEDEDKNDLEFVSPEPGTGRKNRALAKFKNSFQRNLSVLGKIYPFISNFRNSSLTVFIIF